MASYSVTKQDVKLVAAILIDIADFTIGRIIGFGTAFDFVFTLVAVLMFGWKGLFQLWETVEISDQFDGFVPTLTLLALWERRQKAVDIKVSDASDRATEMSVE